MKLEVTLPWRATFDTDERRHAGSPFNIENHGENHARGFN
jgi:hypothetical protein